VHHIDAPEVTEAKAWTVCDLTNARAGNGWERVQPVCLLMSRNLPYIALIGLCVAVSAYRRLSAAKGGRSADASECKNIAL